MNELKLCPLCGSKAEHYVDRDMVKVFCSNYDCQCEMIIWFDEPEKTAEAWNRRVGEGG